MKFNVGDVIDSRFTVDRSQWALLGGYKGWKYCKGSQDQSIYEDNPNVYIDKKFKGIKDK